MGFEYDYENCNFVNQEQSPPEIITHTEFEQYLNDFRLLIQRDQFIQARKIFIVLNEDYAELGIQRFEIFLSTMKDLREDFKHWASVSEMRSLVDKLREEIVWCWLPFSVLQGVFEERLRKPTILKLGCTKCKLEWLSRRKRRRKFDENEIECMEETLRFLRHLCPFLKQFEKAK